MRFDDPAYLRSEQYRDGGILSVRVELHRRFSTNHTNWFQWIFDRLAVPDEARILELGCGTGALWLENQARILPGWQVVLSDLSLGMLRETRGRLLQAGFAPRWCVADAQAIPFADGAFDAVIANHMLYHVPDRARALAELGRVLRPGGLLMAATAGRDNLHELDELAARFAPGTALDDAAARFGLENGEAQLRPWFADVTREDFPNALAITEVEPVVAYLLSTPPAASLDESRIAALREELEKIIARDGAFRVTKTTGLFHCHAFR